VALFDSGSAVGGAIAPFTAYWAYQLFGSWRPAFLVTAVLGALWVFVWRAFYHPVETHPNLDPREREMILASQRQELLTETRALGGGEAQRPATWGQLLRLKQTWGIILGKSLTDPVWFFITDWFAIFLVSKGFKLEDTLIGFWVPFLAADLGNFFGGGFSSHLIKRGWAVGRARKALIVAGSIGVLALIPAAFLSNFLALVSCFAVATFSYAVFSTMALSLPADLFHRRAVASVAGLAGTGAGLGTIGSTFLIGVIADRFSFTPILVGASLVPLVGAVVVLALVKNTAASGRGLVKAI